MSFKKYYKYPRTYHLPWSENLQNDDRLIESLDGFFDREVIVSLKLDGENTNMYFDRVHARSPDSRDHMSRHWIKAFHASIKYKIPEGWRICGENMFALHSIYYTELTSFFYVFAVFDENNRSLSWNDVEDFSNDLGLETVPVLYRGLWDKKKVMDCYSGFSKFRGWTPKPFIKTFEEFRSKIINDFNLETFADETQEGYVCRIADGFSYEDYDKYIAKFVRKSHVKSSNNWMTEVVIPNRIKKETKN